MTQPPDIRKKLQDKLIEGLRELELSDEQIVMFMSQHDRIMEEFLQKVNEAKAGYCPKCGHSYAAHDTELKGAGHGLLPGYNPHNYDDLYQCNAYMGMGDWCGCEERSRRPTMP